MNIYIAFLLMSLVGLASSTDSNMDTIVMEILSGNIDNAERRETDCGEGGNCGVSIPRLDLDLGLNTFTKLLNKSKLFSYVGSAERITQFAETDEAYEESASVVLEPFITKEPLLDQFINYHICPEAVLSGELTDDMLIPTNYGQTLRVNIYPEKGLTTINGQVIELADQIARNGVVHVLGGVLIPSFGTITDTLALCPAMSILNKAVKRAGLRDALAAPGPMTLFAPTDKAFAMLPRWCVSSLLCNRCLLRSVLTYHVVPSTQWAIGFKNLGKLQTVEGGSLRTFIMKDKVFVNYAEVISADGNTINGPVHAINRLLFPYLGADNYCDAVAAANDGAKDLGLEGCTEEDSTSTCDVDDDVELQAILDSVYAEN